MEPTMGRFCCAMTRIRHISSERPTLVITQHTGLLINMKAQSIIVQSLHLFVKHVGSAVGRSMGRHSSLRTSYVSHQGRIGLDQNLCPKQMNPWRCCLSRKHICKLKTIKTNQGYGQTFIKLFHNKAKMSNSCCHIDPTEIILKKILTPWRMLLMQVLIVYLFKWCCINKSRKDRKCCPLILM